MFQWFRNSKSRLVKISIPQESQETNSRVSLNFDLMESPHEEQQSQQGVDRNLNAFRSIRDHIHPPRISAPSCIVPQNEEMFVRPYLVSLLPTFHGMESENPCTHIREFEEVCNTFKEDTTIVDLMSLKPFPFTLKDKAYIWLNSLRPRTFWNWIEMWAEFFKKIFSTHRTNSLKRQISTFSANENEKFYADWERYMEALDAFPDHGFDTWLLISYFYDGISLAMKQLLETMCGGDFLSKNPKEALDFLGYVVEASKGWDEPNPREMERMRPQPSTRGGMYSLPEDLDMKAKLSTLARRLEELEMRNRHEVQEVIEIPMQNKPCFISQSTEHLGEQFLTIPTMREMLVEQENVVGQFKPSTNAPYGNTYNPSWRNHLNLSWKPKPSQYAPPAPPQYASTSQPSQPQSTSPVEQAILNLSKVACNFVEEKKTTNTQLNHKTDTVESTLNKRVDRLQNDISQKIDKLKYSI